MNWNKQRKDYPLAYWTLGVGALHVFIVEYEIFPKTGNADHGSSVKIREKHYFSWLVPSHPARNFHLFLYCFLFCSTVFIPYPRHWSLSLVNRLHSVRQTISWKGRGKNCVNDLLLESTSYTSFFSFEKPRHMLLKSTRLWYETSCTHGWWWGSGARINPCGICFEHSRWSEQNVGSCSHANGWHYSR